MILVSACLVGRPCRYDGRRISSRTLMDRIEGRPWMAVCPEQLGGLPTPRPPADIVDGDGGDVLDGRARIVDAQGNDVTGFFLAGAEQVLALARRVKAEVCYLKDRSPSCAVDEFIDRTGRSRGPGVLAALLRREGFVVVEVRDAGAG